MQEGKLLFWHKVAHLFNIQDEYSSIHVEGDWVVRTSVCNTCGKTRDVRKMCRAW